MGTESRSSGMSGISHQSCGTELRKQQRGAGSCSLGRVLNLQRSSGPTLNVPDLLHCVYLKLSRSEG